MNRRTLTRAATAAALVAAIPLTVIAASSPTIAALKSKGDTEIARRIDNLDAASGKLSESKTVTDADKATLRKQIEDEVNGLTDLKEKLDAETTIAGARADVASIVTDYRVYALILPKVRMTASADRFAVVEDKLTALHDKLVTKAGTDATLKSKLDDMSAKIAAAKTTSSSVVSQVIALQPTDYNQNHTVLVQYRASLKSAQQDLKAARDDAKFVIDSLKAAK
jgi:hypothetical protein